MTEEEYGIITQGSQIPAAALGEVVRELMRPVLEGLAKALENNTAALEQLSIQQQIQSDRLEALEKQARLRMPVTGKQAGYLNAEARDRARALMEKRGICDEKAVRKLAECIRRDVLKRYGVSGMRDIPGYEYRVAMDMIGMWNDSVKASKIAREARETAENEGNDGQS